MLDVQPGMSSQKLSQGPPLVGGRIIQQDDDRTAQMAQQFPEKPANFLLPDIVEVKLIVRPRCCRRGLTEIPEMTETLSRRPWR